MAGPLISRLQVVTCFVLWDGQGQTVPTLICLLPGNDNIVFVWDWKVPSQCRVWRFVLLCLSGAKVPMVLCMSGMKVPVDHCVVSVDVIESDMMVPFVFCASNLKVAECVWREGSHGIVLCVCVCVV